MAQNEMIKSAVDPDVCTLNVQLHFWPYYYRVLTPAKEVRSERERDSDEAQVNRTAEQERADTLGNGRRRRVDIVLIIPIERRRGRGEGRSRGGDEGREAVGVRRGSRSVVYGRGTARGGGGRAGVGVGELCVSD